MKAVRPRASIQSKGQGALGRLGFFADAACGLFGSEAFAHFLLFAQIDDFVADVVERANGRAQLHVSLFGALGEFLEAWVKIFS